MRYLSGRYALPHQEALLAIERKSPPGIGRRIRLVPPRPMPRISSVTIRDLYGRYSYENLPFSDLSNEAPDVTLIFGENGTGKSTILRLIYSCLCSNSGEGLRTYIATTPFSYFSISLSVGLRISVTKAKSRLRGGYTFRFETEATKQVHRIKTDDDGMIRSQPSISAVERRIDSLGFDIIFIDHNRRLRSNARFMADSPRKRDDTDEFEEYDDWHRRHLREQNVSISQEEDPMFPLMEILSEVEEWIRLQAIRQGFSGDLDASAVYVDVIRALSKRKRNTASIEATSIQGLIDEIRRVEAEAEPYKKHGLLSKYPFDEMVASIEAAPSSRTDEIASVVAPFLNAIRKRMGALQSSHIVISAFENSVNKFLVDKSVSLDILSGAIFTVVWRAAVDILVLCFSSFSQAKLPNFARRA
jgi:hypothetical protein